ncbi:MAG: DNA/RNA non-specific endonuclease [Lachnospiraceae bacterium]|nr:DNA/RNA non-specific endonuclease [Lachnospiraceae bacterium]
MKKWKGNLALVILCISICICSCGKADTIIPAQEVPMQSHAVITLDEIPEYSGIPYVEINGNMPLFTENDYSTEVFESYSELDSLGRCGVCFANIGIELMPTEERGEIGQIKPSGWQLVKYDFVDGKYLYNRSHLIGYQLSGENANEKNLITGTRYMNVQGMLPFENMIAEYVKNTGNHVLYRVTPVFEGNNLVASGVQMEAKSVEDDGAGVCFHVYVYNCQPGVTIDYANGMSALAENEADADIEDNEETSALQGEGTTYILNTNTHKFHYPSCSSVDDMKEKNKQEYQGNREDIIKQGYDPCKRCNP